LSQIVTGRPKLDDEKEVAVDHEDLLKVSYHLEGIGPKTDVMFNFATS
jgi:hypothetical protein